MAKKSAKKLAKKTPSIGKPSTATAVSNSVGKVATKDVPDPEVLDPVAGAWTVARDVGGQDLIYVNCGEFEANTTTAWAKFHGPGVDPNIPADPAGLGTNGFTQLTSDGNFRRKSVLVPSSIAPATTPPAGNNIECTVVVVSGGTITELPRVGFKYIGNGFLINVNGFACPWFAYRQDETGPAGEDIELHRPEKLRLPINAISLTINKPTGTTAKWRHAPPPDPTNYSTASFADGYDYPHGPWNLKDDRYRTQSNIGTPGYPTIVEPDGVSPIHNLLVGILDPYLKSEFSTNPPKIRKIGYGSVSFDPARYKAILLGMWDGSQWTQDVSNSGHVELSVDWAAADPGV